ncbi:uncharacterized protein LOC111708965 [Eurytemora carolleeae]|uniref:uncharacterized protein LOC111708965 n=1 Tax=Eurytemora carolleeae TaxID=1294199 RepID=UPI000C76A2CA|nr:uncharacterized protein LOC111708965 [Eurytemora carolleeae]|eukprot:XP_023338263.1 uncharacterized protein LOC111708965 [Eurytemora affinis]
MLKLRWGKLFVSSYKQTPRLYHTSFSTDDKDKGYHMLGYVNAASCIINGRPNFKFPPHYNIDLDSFFTGARKAVESISTSLSRRNISELSSLVSSPCLDNIRQRIFEEMTVDQIKQIQINAEDIFLQYIESAQIQDDHVRIVLISFSLPLLNQCKINHLNMKKFQTNIHNKAKKSDGILKREDLNAKELRELVDSLENLNMDKLAKEGSILVSSYTFERPENSDVWSVVSISHKDSAEMWSRLRRMIWKGRVHISVKFDRDFYDIIRFDYAIDLLAVLALVYLQLLALVLGYKMEKEIERRNRMEADQIMKDNKEEDLN